jgi:hypothetical protein
MHLRALRLIRARPFAHPLGLRPCRCLSTHSIPAGILNVKCLDATQSQLLQRINARAGADQGNIQSNRKGSCLYTSRVTLGFHLHEVATLQDRLGFRTDRFAPLMEKLAITNT